MCCADSWEVVLDDHRQLLGFGRLVDEELCEFRAYADWQLLLPCVCCRIHAGEEAKVAMAWHTPIEDVEDSVEALRRRQVDLVDQQPVSELSSLCDNSADVGERQCRAATGQRLQQTLRPHDELCPVGWLLLEVNGAHTALDDKAQVVSKSAA